MQLRSLGSSIYNEDKFIGYRPAADPFISDFLIPLIFDGIHLYGFWWILMDFDGFLIPFIRIWVDSIYIRRILVDSIDFRWILMDSIDFRRILMDSTDFRRILMESIDFRWILMDSIDFRWILVLEGGGV